jgi:hypothetical protein
MSAGQAYVLQRPARRRAWPDRPQARGRATGLSDTPYAIPQAPIGAPRARIGRPLPSHVVLWRTNSDLLQPTR